MLHNKKECKILIGERIRACRTKHGISQQQLAKALKVSQTCISKYEIGENEPNVQTIVKLSNFFHVSVDYLIGVNEEPLYLVRISEDEKRLLSYYNQMNKSQKMKFCACLTAFLQE